MEYISKKVPAYGQFVLVLCIIRRISLWEGYAGVQGGSEDPPAKIFGVYDPKRCIFKAFYPVSYVISDE